MDSEDTKRQPSQPTRRPYAAPRVEESATFEHLVLTCTFATTTACNPKKGGKQFSS